MGYVVKAACAMVKVGDTYVTVAKGGAVPANADADHVALLAERGLIVEGEPSGFETDPDTPPPFKVAKQATQPPEPLAAYPVDGPEADQDLWVTGASVAAIQAYVAANPDSAKSVLAAELRRDQASRKTLTDSLTKLTEGS
ncbi:hypothetical protein [Jatrophihabitans sp.]|uniref:hypothetical protein n=1 Tax=Jatrophihabitans sp. TaxID=1932789 RepID=UPI0030C69B93|nr:hypothetical protein [Jatrophihabitans sp.]